MLNVLAAATAKHDHVPVRNPLLSLNDFLLAWQCSFTINAYDSKENKRFASGSDDWEMTVDGMSGWAFEGRQGEFVYINEAPFSAAWLW